jgi:hypothetical protein
VIWACTKCAYLIDYNYYDGWHGILQTVQPHKFDMNVMLLMTNEALASTNILNNKRYRTINGKVVTFGVASYWDIYKNYITSDWFLWDQEQRKNIKLYNKADPEDINLTLHTTCWQISSSLSDREVAKILDAMHCNIVTREAIKCYGCSQTSSC